MNAIGNQISYAVSGTLGPLRYLTPSDIDTPTAIRILGLTTDASGGAVSHPAMNECAEVNHQAALTRAAFFMRPRLTKIYDERPGRYSNRQQRAESKREDQSS